MSKRAKARHSYVDLQRFADRYGVPLAFAANFPINTLTLMRGAIGLQRREPQRFMDYVRAIFQAMWVEARDLSDPQVLGRTLAEAGFEPQAMLALVGDQEVKDALKANTEAAVKRGVYGAPTMFVGEQMFFGQDRLDFVREALA